MLNRAMLLTGSCQYAIKRSDSMKGRREGSRVRSGERAEKMFELKGRRVEFVRPSSFSTPKTKGGAASRNRHEALKQLPELPLAQGLC